LTVSDQPQVFEPHVSPLGQDENALIKVCHAWLASFWH
jgi:hypothetical protein